MSKRLVLPLIILAAMALAVVLNPSPERHRDEIREAVASRSPVAGVLGLGKLMALSSTYHSVGVASYTTAGNRTLSVGAFGLVHVRD